MKHIALALALLAGPALAQDAAPDTDGFPPAAVRLIADLKMEAEAARHEADMSTGLAAELMTRLFRYQRCARSAGPTDRRDCLDAALRENGH